MMKKFGKQFAIFALAIVSVIAFSFSVVSAADNSSAVEIEIDYGDYDPRYLPVGLVGETYPVFDSEATCGEESVTDISIFVYAPDGKILPVTGNRFRTETAGEYTIEYVAKKSDKTGRKSVVVSVTDDERALSYTFGDEIVSGAYTGASVFVYDGTMSGGIGEVTVETSVSRGDTEINLSKADGGYYFVPEKSGEYAVKVTLSDFVGRKVPFEKTITITDSEKPVLNVPSLPRSVVLGATICFPTADGILYKGDEKIYMPVSVYFDGEKIGKEMTAVASKAGSFEVKYVCENGAEKSEYVAAIDVIPEKSIFIEQHLFFDNFESASSYGENDYNIKTVKGCKNASFSFDTALPESVLAIEMRDVTRNYASAKIIITDSKKADQKIAIPVIKFGKSYYAKYDAQKSALTDEDGEIVYNIKHYVDGRKFEGFDSGKAYISVELCDVRDESVVTFYRIGTRRITARKLSNTVEFLTSDDYRSAMISYVGDTVETDVVTAYDLFGSSVPVTFEVTAPDGDVVLSGKADKQYSFKTEAFGDYTIEYFAEGAESIFTTVFCYDIVPPEIKVGKIPASVTVGTTLTLPEAEYSDNHTSKEELLSYVYVLYGNNLKELIKGGSYTFKTAGKYTIRYVVYDEYQNYTVAEFTVIAR